VIDSCLQAYILYCLIYVYVRLQKIYILVPIIIDTRLISVHGSKNTITNIKPDCEITIFQEINIGRKREKFLLKDHILYVIRVKNKPIRCYRD